MKHKRHTPVRSPNEAVLSANIPKNLKDYLIGRAFLLDRPIANLVRFALEYQKERAWKDIPLAALTPEMEKRLQSWLDSGADLKRLV